MGFLRRVSYTNASYLENQLGPLPVENVVPVIQEQPQILVPLLPPVRQEVHPAPRQRGRPRIQREIQRANRQINNVAVVRQNDEQHLLEPREMDNDPRVDYVLICSIYLEDMQNPIQLMPCGHQFCQLCILQLRLNEFTTCALCRTTIDRYIGL